MALPGLPAPRHCCLQRALQTRVSSHSKPVSPEAGYGSAAKRGGSAGKAPSMHSTAVVAHHTAAFVPRENKKEFNIFIRAPGSPLQPMCPLSHSCWVQVLKGVFLLIYLFNLLIYLYHSQDIFFQASTDAHELLCAELLGIMSLLFRSCRAASVHCRAPADKPVPFPAAKNPFLAKQKR